MVRVCSWWQSCITAMPRQRTQRYAPAGAAEPFWLRSPSRSAPSERRVASRRRYSKREAREWRSNVERELEAVG